MSFEQTLTQVGFEQAQLTADAGLTQVQGGGGTADAAHVRHHRERFQLAQIHRKALNLKIL
jgi:hypothetical protein